MIMVLPGRGRQKRICGERERTERIRGADRKGLKKESAVSV